MKSYAVIGLGRFGSQIAKRLYDLGQEVLAIDTDEAIVNKMSEDVTRAVCCDAKDKDVLLALDVKKCDIAIVAMSSDLTASILIAMNLKSIGVEKIIAKAKDNVHKEILEKIGVDEVIIPERVIADKMAVSLTSSHVLDFIEVSEQVGIAEITAPTSWIGKTIKDLNVRAKFGVNIIAVKIGDKIIVNIAPDFIIAEDTIFEVLGEYENLDKIKKIK